MAKKIKHLSLLILILILCFSFSLTGFASTVNERLYYTENVSLMSIAYRGDTAVYPANSLEGVLSAFNKGADMVSVNVMKTSDGFFVLCEDKPLYNLCKTTASSVSELTFAELSALPLLDGCSEETAFFMPLLEGVISSMANIDGMLVLDFDIELSEELYNFLLSKNALSFCVMRMDMSAKKAEEFLANKTEKPLIMGLYNGFVVWGAINHIEDYSALGMPFVCYQSKNYFNTMFDDIVNGHYRTRVTGRAVCSTYNPDLCGQRTDGEDGWNELIKKNFTIIETNNIVSLVSYIEKSNTLSSSLSSLIERAKKYNLALYSQVSAENLEDAIVLAEISSSTLDSCDEKQQAYSTLLNAINNLAIKQGEDTQKGALSVTAGKVIAAVLVGGALFAAQIFVHKMQKKKAR